MATPIRIRIRIEDDLDTARRQDLVGKLEHAPGIACIYYPARTPHVLTLDYDPAHFSPDTLLDLVRRHGLRARLV